MIGYRFKGKQLLVACQVVLSLFFITSCEGTSGVVLQDGYYTAESADFDADGWKEFVTICVSGGKIVMVEYDAKNLSGFVKSWDMDYMRTMYEIDGTYPNEYTRVYSESLRNRQTPSEVDTITGATKSHDIFKVLAEAAMDKARRGDKNVAFVDFIG